MNFTDVEQYNWFSSGDMSKIYASGDKMSTSNVKYDSLSTIKDTLRFKNFNYLKAALETTFNGDNNKLLHRENKYVNACIVALDYMKDPAAEVEWPTNNGDKYIYGTGTAGLNLIVTKIGINVKTWTYEHSTGCCTDSVVNYRTYDNFAECITKDFLNSRLPNPVDYTK